MPDRARLSAWVFYATFFLGAAQMFALVLGANFVPSPAWAKASDPVGSWAALILAIAVVAMLFQAEQVFGLRIPQIRAAVRHILNTYTIWERLKAAASLVLIANFFACLAQIAYFGFLTAVWFGPPLAAAALESHPISIDYEIFATDLLAGGACDVSVDPVGTIHPFAFRICVFPSQIASPLAPGDVITLTGHGTKLGMFYEDITIKQ